MATWTGTTPYATKKQLVSSISGLYDDLQDFQFSTITSVSTLTVKNWISTPLLNVSDIVGANLDISGVVINKDGVFNAPIVSLSSMSMKGFDSLLDVDVSFDFGLGKAIGGVVGGLGALVGGGLIAVGTGAGLAIQGAEQGIATMVAGRPQNFISQTGYETINFTTQLQVSTLGNAYPLYSTIFRTVSSVSANQVPGREIFTSSFFNPGTVCIRSVSDPFNLITGDSNVNTSTLQSFGQWVPLPEQPDVLSTFTDITLSNTSDNSLLRQWREPPTLGQLPMMDSIQYQNSQNNLNVPYNSVPYPNIANVSKVFYHRDEYLMNNTYISTPYVRFQSTITDSSLQFIRSTLSAPLELTYVNNFTEGNFVFCEPDETGFRSTMTVDLRVLGTSNLFIQWGEAADNLNSTIAAGTSKRVSWDILAAYSNFIDIPQALSTVTNEATQQILDIKTNPYEWIFNTLGTGMSNSRAAWNVQGMMFGSNTSLSNYANYPYQFNSSLFVNGTLEAQTVIALSSIFATSTFVDTQVSTTSLLADVANIVELYNREGYISTLRSTSNNWTNDYINVLSRVRMAGFDTPLGIVTGVGAGGPSVYDTNYRFDFTTDTFPQSLYIQSRPKNNTLMTITSTNVEIPNLTVDFLLASNIVFNTADVPGILTSSITFGWSGDFNNPSLAPDFSLNQSLATPPGAAWNGYGMASNQVLNIMGFSNTVDVLAYPFSTPLVYVNTEFGGANRDGWASTIFYNAQANPTRVYLAPNAGIGEVSLQAQTFNVVALMNQSQQQAGVGTNVAVPVGSTYKFSSDGSQWTTLSNAPSPGTIQYNNFFQMKMDFENVFLSTTDTLNLNAENIVLNGTVIMPDAQMSNLYLNNFLSANQIYLNADPPTDYSINILRTYTGPLNSDQSANPFTINNTVNSTDNLNTYPTVNPNRGANLFNSYNRGEWNNNMYGIDTNVGSGLPILILGDVIEKIPPFQPYSGQFFLNNAIDGSPSNIPIYVNRSGYLSTIGYAVANQFTRVYTNDGTLWSIQSNVPNPQGQGGYTYSNFFTTSMNSKLIQVQHGQPLLEVTPTRYVQTNKIIFDCPQIRTYTIGSPSFPSKESGFELSSYFDANVVFGEGGSSPTESDALNPIVNAYNNYYYSVAGWSAQTWFGRMRTESLGIQGFEIEPVAGLISGTLGDFIWFSDRYINVNGPSPTANIREIYFMTPKNYHTSFGWLGQL